MQRSHRHQEQERWTIFFMTQPPSCLSRINLANCRMFPFELARGTQKPVWWTTESGSVLAHCLLPVRGGAPVLQPVETGKGLLLYSGELWDIERGSSDTIALCERVESLGLKGAVARSQGMWALVTVNPRRKELSFCTDMFGEQPLHYAV